MERRPSSCLRAAAADVDIRPDGATPLNRPGCRAHEFAHGGDEAGAAVYLRLVKAIVHLRPKLRFGEP
jgi:hypothetical protein